MRKEYSNFKVSKYKAQSENGRSDGDAFSSPSPIRNPLFNALLAFVSQLKTTATTIRRRWRTNPRLWRRSEASPRTEEPTCSTMFSATSSSSPPSTPLPFNLLVVALTALFGNYHFFFLDSHLCSVLNFPFLTLIWVLNSFLY